MSKKLLTELRSFAETTSVRGIPRVMKAKTRVTFVVWLVAVLTCAALLVWQLGVVLTRYFQYPVSTLTVQAPAWQNPTFPDITVCNLDPNIYPDANMNNLDPNKIVESINQSFSYTMNLPVISTKYSGWFGVNNFTGQISAAWDPYYYKCFTLRPLNSERGNIFNLNAFMYVDQVSEDVDGQSSMGLYIGPALSATGLRVMVHSPGTAPETTFGVNVSPGTLTTIQLTQTVRTRLGQPYSNCTNQQHLPLDNTSDAYTQRYCVNVCIQQKVIDQCGCITVNMPQYTMAQLRQVNFQICEILNLSTNSSQSLESNCVSDITFLNVSTVAAMCSAACVLPCSEYEYEAAIDAVIWPSVADLNATSSTILSGPSFSYLFTTSANATEDEINNAITSPAATDFFKSRFLQLNVQFDSQSFVELKDVAAFSVDAMGAQIGGVLSLWLGVTVMFAFEAFEFIYTYLTNCRKEQPTQGSSTSVAPGIETKSSVNPTETGPNSNATWAFEMDLFQMVVVQID